MALAELLVIYTECVNADVHELCFKSFRKTIIIWYLLFQIDDIDTPF